MSKSKAKKTQTTEKNDQQNDDPKVEGTEADNQDIEQDGDDQQNENDPPKEPEKKTVDQVKKVDVKTVEEKKMETLDNLIEKYPLWKSRYARDIFVNHLNRSMKLDLPSNPRLQMLTEDQFLDAYEFFHDQINGSD